jgi:hypothetical protein
MYDEPELEPSELLVERPGHRRPAWRRLGRAIAAAVPVVAGFWWLSALLGVGPMVGQETTGFVVAAVSMVVWSATLGRSSHSR